MPYDNPHPGPGFKPLEVELDSQISFVKKGRLLPSDIAVVAYTPSTDVEVAWVPTVVKRPHEYRDGDPQPSVELRLTRGAVSLRYNYNHPSEVLYVSNTHVSVSGGYIEVVATGAPDVLKKDTTGNPYETTGDGIYAKIDEKTLMIIEQTGVGHFEKSNELVCYDPQKVCSI